MKTHYELLKKTHSYGVKITKTRYVYDVSNDYSVAKRLVDCCNRNSVDFDHFHDVFENFAEDFKTF